MGALVKWVNILTLSVFGNHSVEPEVPGQEEVDSPPEAAPVMEPEPPVVELKPELVAEAEAQQLFVLWLFYLTMGIVV